MGVDGEESIDQQGLVNVRRQLAALDRRIEGNVQVLRSWWPALPSLPVLPGKEPAACPRQRWRRPPCYRGVAFSTIVGWAKSGSESALAP